MEHLSSGVLVESIILLRYLSGLWIPNLTNRPSRGLKLMEAP